MQKRNIPNSPRLLELKKKRRRVFLNKILLSVFALPAIFAGLVYLSRISAFNINSVEVKGNKVADTEMIRQVVEKEIAGNYLWFFPKRNIFFYPKKDIKNQLAFEFKGLKDINLIVKEKTLNISSTERIAKYMWCGNANLDLVVGLPSDKEKCYFVDENGYIFGEAPYFSGEVYFKFYGGTFSNSTDPSGFYFMQENFSKLISFKNMLENFGLKPVALSYEGSENIKIYLSRDLTHPSGPEIIFKADSDLPIISENLQTALNTEPLKSNFKNKYSSLLYIDLRFGNKVYYKFR